MDPALLDYAVSFCDSIPTTNCKSAESNRNTPLAQSHTKRASAHTWSSEQTSFFLEKYAEMHDIGNYTDGVNFKKEAWTILFNQINEKFGLRLEKTQLKIKKDCIKQLYTKYEFLRSLSGAGWDKRKQIIVADNDLWDKLKSQHPNAGYKKSFGFQCPHYQLCAKVFPGIYATGKLAQSVPNPYAEN
ncbi:hypothetical protein O181_052231 [Austropuccinia psidii MF-1]|uniref:Myb/SANT-like domain-containing protein n=1 Tax=Austropuccinia psidii MF-1 TaxID=1389203 RepID=A0A9Q3HP33_9BASI|nr:hypothetical protein [Austropuccinia psidii MF-1]